MFIFWDIYACRDEQSNRAKRCFIGQVIASTLEREMRDETLEVRRSLMKMIV